MMKTVIAAASLALLTGVVHAETQYTCRAQCVYLNVETQSVDFGFAIDGWSTYSIPEAFVDMSRHCTGRNVMVQSMAGRVHREDETERYSGSSSSQQSTTSSASALSIDRLRRHRIKGLRVARAGSSSSSSDTNWFSYARVRTDKDFEYDLKYATSAASCRSEDVDPNVARRYSGSEEALGG